MSEPEPVSCVHCGGLANHRPMPDGTDCPTARVIAMLRGGRRAVEGAVEQAAPKVNGKGGEA